VRRPPRRIRTLVPIQRTSAARAGQPQCFRDAAEPANTESTVPDKTCTARWRWRRGQDDAIESEMARDFMRPSGGGPVFSNSAANSTLGRLSQQPVEQPVPQTTTARDRGPIAST